MVSLTSLVLYLGCVPERNVAQPGRALGLGPRSRRFKSCHSDHLLNLTTSQLNNMPQPHPDFLNNMPVTNEGNTPVDHPVHYNRHPSGVECIDVVEHMGFNLGNAVKYIWRADLKNDDATEDLKKAAWYIKRELKRRGVLEDTQS